MLKSGSASRRYSLQWPQPQPWELVRRLVEDLLASCDQALQAHDPEWVGHCKAMVASAGAVAYGSVGMAGAPPVWAGKALPPSTATELTLYAAIYGLQDPQVAAALDQAWAAQGPAWGSLAPTAQG